jgi:hypothetical protein
MVVQAVPGSTDPRLVAAAAKHLTTPIPGAVTRARRGLQAWADARPRETVELRLFEALVAALDELEEASDEASGIMRDLGLNDHSNPKSSS